MAVLFLIVFWLALLGFALSTAAFVWWVFCPQPPDTGAYLPLALGLATVWAPTGLTAYWLAGDFKRKDFWKATLRGCPGWMRWLVYGLWAFAFPTALLLGPNGFLPILMAFYLTSAATMVSASNVVEADPARRCPNGHLALDSATFCPDCGARISDDSKSKD